MTLRAELTRQLLLLRVSADYGLQSTDWEGILSVERVVRFIYHGLGDGIVVQSRLREDCGVGDMFRK